MKKVQFILFKKRKLGKKGLSLMLCIAMMGTIFNTMEVNAKNETSPNTVKVDFDGDGVEDWIEDYFGSDNNKSDTDDDGINDYDEIYVIHTNPTIADTDGNGIADGEEDTDNDGLTNVQEYIYGTNLVKADTDSDGLNDYQEIFVYQTDVTVYDTDGDGASDGWETKNGYSALDYNETFATSSTLKAERSNTSLTVSLDSATGKQVETLIVREVLEDIHIRNSISGYLGSYFEIKMDGKVNSAFISLEFDAGLLNNTEFEPAIFYYNEDAQKVVELKNQTVKENVITVATKHYSKLLLLNKATIGKVKKSDIKNLSTKELFTKDLGTKDITKITSLKNSSDVNITESNRLMNISALSEPILLDTDYDGIDDINDSNPLSNNFSGTLVNGTMSSNVSYKVDYRAFFEDNTLFNTNLSTSSSLWASTIYSGITLNGMGIGSLMNRHGLSDVVVYKLSDNYYDNHLSEVAIGHRLVNYNGVTKDVVSVAVRGTNGTTQEWSSNFDIGDTGEFNSYADWQIINNHKGFDIAATRILKKVKEYITTYVDTSVETPVWITGHSRGAAIANILGARLENENYNTYTYTFATPNTTTASNASSYTSIFNVINTDDFVPYLPMTDWGFTRYGKTASISIADNYEVEWENLTGIFDYNPDTLGMQNTVDTIAALSHNRNETNDYTCTAHGNGTSNNITVRNYGTSKASREGAIAKIPTNALPYSIITRYNGWWIAGWDFDNCQTTSYFMQVLAAKMSGDISNYRFVVELNVADKYENAKTAVISSALGGLEHPHYQESYYLLSTHVNAYNFN